MRKLGLDYFGVRYYASWLGRWTSGDPGGFVDGLNLYRYVQNNPVNGVDELGYSTENVELPKSPPAKKKEKVNTIEGGNPLGAVADEVTVIADSRGDGWEPPHNFVRYDSLANDEGIYLPPGVKPKLDENGRVTFFMIGRKPFFPYKNEDGSVEGYRTLKRGELKGTIYDPQPRIKIEFNQTRREVFFLRHDGFFKVEGIPASDGLEIIQVVFASKPYPKAQEQLTEKGKSIYLGTNNYRLTLEWNNEKFLESEALVDGGRYSTLARPDQRGEEAFPGKPFYLPQEALDGQFHEWNGQSGYVAFDDNPSAHAFRPFLRFGVFVVARDYMGTGEDIILGAYSWGNYRTKSIKPNGEKQPFEPNLELIPEMIKVIKNDYRDYKLFGY